MGASNFRDLRVERNIYVQQKHSPFCTSLLLRVKVTYVLIHTAFGTELQYVTGKLRFDSRRGKKFFVFSGNSVSCPWYTKSPLQLVQRDFFPKEVSRLGREAHYSCLVLSTRKYTTIPPRVHSLYGIHTDRVTSNLL